jgi:DNA-binding transcriptional MocR family regulator
MEAGRDAAEPFLYERLAAEIVELIRVGTLRPGDRLPSVRRMSARWRVSVPTVLQAYRLLEARRVIRARPRSGFYVQPPDRFRLPEPERTEPPGEAREVSTADLIVDFLQAVGDPALMPLGAAIPDAALLPVERLGRHLARAARVAGARAAVVATPLGCEELRREVARRAFEAGIRIGGDDVVVTAGCSEALMLCLRALTRPGDAVAVESPAYFGTLQAIAALGLRAVEIPTDPRMGLCVDALDAVLARGDVAAVVVTPSVHNPTGAVMPEEARRALADVLARHGVPAIEDDTYGDLCFGDARPRSLRAFDRAGLVLTCGSFSKTLAPAYRVGWVIPGRWRSAVLRLKAASTQATATPLQLALAGYLRAGGYDHHLRRLRRTLQQNLARLRCEVAARFPAGTRLTDPGGGFVLWVELPPGMDAVALYRHALERGISTAPGPVFSATGAYGNCLRLSAGHPWSERTDAAVAALAALASGERA